MATKPIPHWRLTIYNLIFTACFGINLVRLGTGLSWVILLGGLAALSGWFIGRVFGFRSAYTRLSAESEQRFSAYSALVADGHKKISDHLDEIKSTLDRKLSEGEEWKLGDGMCDSDTK